LRVWGFRISGFGFRMSGFGFQCSSWPPPSPPETCFRVSRLWFRDQDFGMRISCSGFRVPCSVFRLQCFGFRVSGPVFRVPGFGFRVPCFGLSVSSSGFRVSGVGCRVWGFPVFEFGVSGPGAGLSRLGDRRARNLLSLSRLSLGRAPGTLLSLNPNPNVETSTLNLCLSRVSRLFSS